MTQGDPWAGAECRGSDPELFFAEYNERGNDRRTRERAAKRVCARCPLTAACLSYALERRERYGVWGGRSPDERDDLLRSTACR